MDERSLKSLEFDKIQGAVASRALSALGARRAQEMTPVPDAAARMLAEAAEMMRCVQTAGDVPLEGISDVGPLLRRLELDGVLVGAELIQVRNFLLAAGRGRRAWGDADVYPNLSAYASALVPLRDLSDLITRQLDDDGLVRDDATPLLAQIRKRIAAKETEIQEALERTLKSAAVRKALREPIITQRAGRYVLPVRTDSLHAVRGIVHGHSSTGVTAFVEPMSVIEINNQLEGLKAEEEAEVIRILRDLSCRLRSETEALTADLDILEELDFVAARAIFGLAYSCIIPAIIEEPFLDLHRARHPLLLASRRPEQVVPIDFQIGGDYDVIIISGPNNGGKTVGMKTAGLLAAMALAGLPIPAGEGSVVGKFRNLSADIGDESSLEGNLSTFTAHMTNVRKCLGIAGEHTLVLLDELGVGTSPKYGVAIATAVLSRLAASRTKVVCTTHYDELKTLALDRERFVNAAVEIDPYTLAPTYELKMGRPGASEAIAILERLGFPADVVADSLKYLGEEEVSLGNLIKRLEEREARAAETARALDQELEGSRREREAYQAQRELLEDREARRREAAYDEAARILRDARRQANLLIRELRTNADLAAAEETRRSLLEAQKEAETKAEEARSTFTDDAAAKPAAVAEGDWVTVRGTSARGQVAEADAERAQARVRFGGVEAWVAFRDLVPVAPPGKKGGVRASVGGDVSPSLNVIGLTVEEALPQVDRYLDQALAARITSVELIHGHGTGRLRDGVRRFLRTHAAVASFGPGAGGNEGCTIANLKVN